MTTKQGFEVTEGKEQRVPSKRQNTNTITMNIMAMHLKNWGPLLKIGCGFILQKRNVTF